MISLLFVVVSLNRVNDCLDICIINGVLEGKDNKIIVNFWEINLLYG